jgi:hypothetical protein
VSSLGFNIRDTVTQQADARQASPFDNSGFVVNFPQRAGVLAPSGLPGWVLAAAAIAALVWLMTKHKG